MSRVLCLTQLNRSFWRRQVLEAITCTGSDNSTQNKQENYNNDIKINKKQIKKKDTGIMPTLFCSLRSYTLRIHSH